MRRLYNFVTGSILGGLIGAVVILLMTPSSGEELRDTARDRVDRFFQEIRNASANRRAELERQLEELKRGSDK